MSASPPSFESFRRLRAGALPPGGRAAATDPASPRHVDAVLRVTLAQWTAALRAEGAPRRAAAIEARAARGIRGIRGCREGVTNAP